MPKNVFKMFAKILILKEGFMRWINPFFLKSHKLTTEWRVTRIVSGDYCLEFLFPTLLLKYEVRGKTKFLSLVYYYYLNIQTWPNNHSIVLPSDHSMDNHLYQLWKQVYEFRLKLYNKIFAEWKKKIEKSQSPVKWNSLIRIEPPVNIHEYINRKV